MLKYEISYESLAIGNGIKFTHHPTMGFNTIKKKKGYYNVIGPCTYGKNFREIDADIDFWNKSSDQTRRVLLYHELTHCLCDRDHDYKNGIKYPDADTVKGNIIMEFMEPGVLKDGCPMTIMYPYILSDKCSFAHWNMYIKEMFNRCIPY